MTEDKINVIVMGVVNYKLTIKWLPLISACCIESQKSSDLSSTINHHSDSILGTGVLRDRTKAPKFALFAVHRVF